MKVLFVCSGNSGAGINPIIERQADSLIKNGVDIVYFTIKGRGISGYLKHIKYLRGHLKKNSYDLIHAHYGFCGITSLFARKREKLLISFMGEDIMASYDFKGRFTNISKFYVRINKFFARYYYDYIIIKSFEMSHFLGDLKNSIVIPNGVDLDLFRPTNKEVARKRIGISINLRLVIFVSDPERPEKNFKLAQQAFDLLNIENKKLMPIYNVPNKELPDYYNAADVLLLTSYHEGSPNVIKEAMACNCPIVSTNVGDVNDVISGTEGCFITSFIEEEVASAIHEAIIYGKRTEGRKVVQKELGSDRVAERIISVYHNILKN